MPKTGWRHEPARHALARKGISTKSDGRVKLIREMRERSGAMRNQHVEMKSKSYAKQGFTEYDLKYKYSDGHVIIHAQYETQTQRMTILSIGSDPPGMGLGTLALQEFEKYAKSIGARSMHIFSLDESRKFWRKSGYKLDKDDWGTKEL